MPSYYVSDKSCGHRQIKLDLSKVRKENWGRVNFNVWENYTMRYNRVKHRKASFVSFKRILYEILLNDQKASSLLEILFQSYVIG